jgi:hypothetical protein
MMPEITKTPLSDSLMPLLSGDMRHCSACLVLYTGAESKLGKCTRACYSSLANNCMGIEPMKKRIYKKPEIKKCGKLENATAFAPTSDGRTET